MDTSQTPSLSSDPAEKSLVPTTDRIAQECPRFRILIVGRSGVGKSALINAIFKASLADVKDNRAGTANINREMTSEQNKLLALHDSEGYEPGEEDKFSVLKDFVKKRNRKKVADRIHAIWLCIPVPFADGRTFEDGDEKIFKLDRNKAPIIVVFTKYDLLVASATAHLTKVGTNEGTLLEKSQEMAENIFQDKCVGLLKELTKDLSERIHHVRVSTKDPNSLQNLVEITMQNVHVETSTPSFFARFKGRSNVQNAEVKEDLSDSAKVTFAAAQRVDMQPKIQASIDVGKKKYWRAIASGFQVLNLKLHHCLNVLHKDVVNIWNIRGLNEYLLGDDFFGRMTQVVQDLGELQQDNTASTAGNAVVAGTSVAGMMHVILGSAVAAGPAAAIVAPMAAAAAVAVWVYAVYKRTPENIRYLMGYVVDLTLIMQAVFQASLENENGNVDKERVMEIVKTFKESERKTNIHNAIWTYVTAEFPFGRDSVVDKMESLIREFSASA